jgi:hypothetical protein
MTAPAPVSSLSDVVTGIVRTVVPVVVGTVLAWLATRGFDLTQYGNAVNVWLVPIVIGAYYALVRLIERKVPAFGLLLGAKKQPVYVDQNGMPVNQPAGDPSRLAFNGE